MQPAKIAIIDDELPIQMMYRMRLEKAGYDVIAASDGVSGLELILREEPQLILLDLKMPIMSGDEMLLKLRQTEVGSRTKVFVLTNISKDEAPNSLRMLHVDRYVIKAHHTPLQITEMINETLGL